MANKLLIRAQELSNHPFVQINYDEESDTSSLFADDESTFSRRSKAFMTGSKQL